MKYLIVLLVISFLFFLQNNLAFGEIYELTVDEKTFEIFYRTDGNVIAMAIDKELTSLLVGLENIERDSVFFIEFPKELIGAEDNAFSILVNGVEVDYSAGASELDTKLTIRIPSDTEEIEIIGTHVIPEFPISVLMILVLVITMGVVFSKSKYRIFR